MGTLRLYVQKRGRREGTLSPLSHRSFFALDKLRCAEVCMPKEKKSDKAEVHLSKVQMNDKLVITRVSLQTLILL